MPGLFRFALCALIWRQVQVLLHWPLPELLHCWHLPLPELPQGLLARAG